MAVAFSGGPDSTALLHATCRALRGTGVEVVALHVHHGLVAEADAWVRHAAALCARWRHAGAALRLRIARLAGSPQPAESIEAWARRGRYAALAALAREEGATLVLLAQHRRDQAETVLLQALRGAGPAGLAAMPGQAQRAGLCWARPWLDSPREAIEAYLRRWRLRPVDDRSNRDRRYARNRLRLDIWPALVAAFPGAELALAALARRASAAAAALAELAGEDLARCADERGLRVGDWFALTPARRGNALRHWCAHGLGGPVPASLVERLLAELPDKQTARWPAPGAELRLYRGRLTLEALQPARCDAPAASPADLSRVGRHRLPGWAGTWIVSACRRGGLAADDLRAVELRPRTGGERLALTPRGRPRSLKKQFQSRRVHAGARSGPLVWSGARLLFVPGLGADARVLASPGVAQRQLRWEPDAVEGMLHCNT